MSKKIELTDLYEVAMLRLQGVDYTRVDDRPPKARFVYDGNSQVKQVEETLRSFYEGKLMGNLQQYKHHLQDLRALVFAMKHSREEVKGRGAR